MTATSTDLAIASEPRLALFTTLITQEARAFQFAPSLIAAIVSRETAGYNCIGDKGHGHGLMQVDDSRSREDGHIRDQKAFDWCEQWKRSGRIIGACRYGPVYEGNEQMGIRRGLEILHAKLKYILSHTDLRDDRLLEATIAAYNTGEGNVVHSWKDMRPFDSTTAGHNYSEDVLAREKVLRALFPNV